MVAYSELKRAPRGLLILLGLAVVIHCFYLGGLRFGYLNRWSYDTRYFSNLETHYWALGPDFFVLYEAGWDFLHGRNMYLRDDATMSTEEALARGLQHAPYYATYRYLPFYGYTLGVVLSFFRPFAAYWLWIIVNEILLGINIHLTRRLCRRPETFALCIIFWISPFPLFVEYFMGQYSVLMGTLVFWTAIFLIYGRKLGAGICWMLSVLLKTYTLLLAPLFYRLKRRADIVICIALVAATSIPYFLIFPKGLEKFYEFGLKGRLGEGASQLYMGSQGIQTALQATANLFRLEDVHAPIFSAQMSLAKLLIITVSLSILVFLVVLTFRKDFDPLAVYCLWIMTFFLFYRDLWEHHYVMLIPVLVLMTSTERLPVWVVVTVFALTGTPTLYRLFGSEAVVGKLHELNAYALLHTLYFLIKPVGVGMLFVGIVQYGRTKPFLIPSAESQMVPGQPEKTTRTASFVANHVNE
jgi:hypothetical protein